MTEELDIPAAAFAVKADYFQRPSKEVVTLIKKFIDRFGTPHLWYGHTHTKPAQGSRVTFLAKYSLPKSHRRRARWAPCPCCSPRHPKYFRQGLIAWFPDEGVIRCVGDQCYKTMDPEGYELAMSQLNAEIASERSTDFLLGRLPLIPQFGRTIEANLPTVRAIDTMRNNLLSLLDKTLAIDIWPEIKTGMLRTTIFRQEVRRGRGGQEEIHSIPDFADYGSVPGYIALKPERSTFGSRLEARKRNLEAIDFGADTQSKIASMTETDKHKIARILSWSHREAVRLISQAEEARRLFSKESIATINGWAKHENCPIQIHLAIDDDVLRVGRDETSHFKLPWPERFWDTLRGLDPLSKTALAA